MSAALVAGWSGVAALIFWTLAQLMAAYAVGLRDASDRYYGAVWATLLERIAIGLMLLFVFSALIAILK